MTDESLDDMLENERSPEYPYNLDEPSLEEDGVTPFENSDDFDDEDGLEDDLQNT